MPTKRPSDSALPNIERGPWRANPRHSQLCRRFVGQVHGGLADWTRLRQGCVGQAPAFRGPTSPRHNSAEGLDSEPRTLLQ